MVNQLPSNVNTYGDLTIPDIQEFKSYLPNSFDDNLTLLQKVNMVIQTLQSMGVSVNSLFDNWNNVVIPYVTGQGLNDDVVNQLTKWKDDGTLDSLINTNLIGSLSNLKTTDKTNIVNAINENTSQLADIAINVKNFGAIGDGVTDCSSAFLNAINSLPNGGIIFIPFGTYLLKSVFPSLSNIIFVGVGKNKTILKRGFTGDLFPSFGGYSGFERLTIDGNTGSNGAGKGVIMPTNSPNSYMLFTEIKNFNDHCLEFSSDSGSEFRAVGCDFYTTGSLGTIGAISVSGTDTSSTSRHFTNCESGGCTLFDFGGCNDFYVTGGYSNGLIFSPNSSKVLLSNMRIGAGAGTTTIDGSAHTLSNIVFAGDVVINGNDINFDCEVPSYNITDNGTGNNINIPNKSYPVLWTAETTNPAIGNGTLNGYYTRNGDRITTQIELVCGSTTTFGSGTMYFSLPRIDYQFGVLRVGYAEISTDDFYIGSVRVIQGAGKVSIHLKNKSGTVGDLSNTLTPFISGSSVRLTIEYITT